MRTLNQSSDSRGCDAGLYPVFERIEEVVRGGGERKTEDRFLRSYTVRRVVRGLWYAGEETTVCFGLGFSFCDIAENEEFEKCAEDENNRELSQLVISVGYGEGNRLESLA